MIQTYQTLAQSLLNLDIKAPKKYLIGIAGIPGSGMSKLKIFYDVVIAVIINLCFKLLLIQVRVLPRKLFAIL